MKNSSGRITRGVLKTIVLIVVVAIACLVVFYIYNPKKAVTLVFPNLNEISYINTVIKNDSAYTTVSVVLQNKNPYKLSIDTILFDLNLNDTSIAHQKIPVNIKQAGFDKDTFKVPLNLSVKQMMNLIRNLQGRDSVDFNAKGYVVYESIFGHVKLDFNKTIRVEVPVPPKIEVIKVERKKFDLKNKILMADATIEILNEGKNLDLQLTEVHYDLVVRNTLHATGMLEYPVTIKPRSGVIVVIPMEIEVYHPLKTIWLIKTDKDRLNYTLHITGKVKENISNNAFASPAEVWATGVLELKK